MRGVVEQTEIPVKINIIPVVVVAGTSGLEAREVQDGMVREVIPIVILQAATVEVLLPSIPYRV